MEKFVEMLKRVHWSLTGVFALGVMAVMLVPGTADAHCKGKHANDPPPPPHEDCSGGGGGGDTSSSLPVKVTFQCPGGAASCDGNVWTDNGVYQDGVDRVSAELTSFGHFNFRVGARKKKVPIRHFVYNYHDAPPGGAVNLETPAGDISSTAAITEYNYGTSIQINRRLTIADPRLMNVGQSDDLDMWFDVTVWDGGDGSAILGRFDAMSTDNCNLPPGAAGDVNVERTKGPPTDSKSQWVVTADAGLEACVTAPYQANPYEAAFDMGGFEMVIDEL